jgi:two-component system, NarL family, sensor histidine kinase UhpB
MDGSPPIADAIRSAGRTGLFFRRSLRIRLVAVVLAVNCLAVGLFGAVIVLKARIATRQEIASSMELAEALAADASRLMANAPVPLTPESIPLPFSSLRHVKLSVTDNDGNPIGESSPSAGRDPDAPAWFARLIAPPAESLDFPIIVRHERAGFITITAEPIDEIDKAWTYARSILAIDIGLDLGLLALLFVLFGRVLAPLTRLVAGLRELEGKNYGVRLPRPSSLELAEIADRFNRAAAALSAAHEANRQLTRKLLTAHDDERRRTALELHDDVGPCLFSLEASAASLAEAAKKRDGDPQLIERVQGIVAIAQGIKKINRQMLDGLRPMALGRIPLKQCIAGIPLDSEEGPAVEFVLGDLRDSYGVLVDLTFYRCAREGILNAVRHARASRIVLSFEERRQILVMRIRDDGRGFDPASREGIGLSGIRERVEALAGSFHLQSSPDGTVLTVTLPIDGAAEPAADNRRTPLP